MLMLRLGLYVVLAVVVWTAMVGAVVVWDIVIYLNGMCSVGGRGLDFVELPCCLSVPLR
jgi:hypothetical protein